MIWRCPFVAAVPISLVGRRENERAERASAKEIEERQRRKERWKDYEMRKGVTRKPQSDEPATPVKNRA